MKTLQDVINILKKHETDIKSRYKIKSLKIFGSYADERQTSASDIDLIVEFHVVPTFIELVKMEDELSQLLGVKVDLLTEESISPFIRPHLRTVEVMK